MSFNFDISWLIEKIKKFLVWFGKILKNLDHEWRQSRIGRILTNPLTVIFLGIIVAALLLRVSFLDSNLQKLQMELDLSIHEWAQTELELERCSPPVKEDGSNDAMIDPDPESESALDLRKEDFQKELNDYERSMQEFQEARKQR